MAEDQAAEKEKRSNLGRGLAALFGDGGPTSEVVEAAPVREQRPVPVESIHPNPHQPRQRFDSETLEQLAESIRENGLLQPILVRPHPSLPDAFEIIAGERRWRAAQLAQLHEVPVIVRDLSDVKTSMSSGPMKATTKNARMTYEAMFAQSVRRDVLAVRLVSSLSAMRVVSVVIPGTSSHAD